MFREKNKNKTPIIIKTTEGIIMEIVMRFFEKIAPKITETPAKETKTGHKVFISYSLKHENVSSDSSYLVSIAILFFISQAS